MKSLYEEMLKLAERDNLPSNHILRIRANELKEIIEGGGEIPTPERLLGRWARAKKAYCEYTGKPLIDPVAIELVTFLTGQKRI
jgi:hypothetical protein